MDAQSGGGVQRETCVGVVVCVVWVGMSGARWSWSRWDEWRSANVRPPTQPGTRPAARACHISPRGRQRLLVPITKKTDGGERNHARLYSAGGLVSAVSLPSAEADDVSDVLHPSHPSEQPLKAEAVSTMGDCSEPAGVDVPLHRFHPHLALPVPFERGRRYKSVRRLARTRTGTVNVISCLWDGRTQSCPPAPSACAPSDCPRRARRLLGRADRSRRPSLARHRLLRAWAACRTA